MLLLLVSVCLIVLLIITCLYKKYRCNIFINDIFWLLFSWIICLNFYYFSGIKYKFQLDLYSLCYIFACLLLFIVGRKITSSSSKRLIDVDINNKINLKPMFFISCISVLLYVIYMIFNNDIVIGVTRDFNTNALSTLLLIFSNISLVVWIYELLYSLLSQKRITWYGLLSALVYNIPGFIISGRDALIIFFISTIISIFFCISYSRKNAKTKMNIKKIYKWVIISFIIILIYLIFLSNNRYGNSSTAMIQMFEWSASCELPEYLKNMSYNGIGKVINNIIFYYSSQFSKFSLIFNDYSGPYLHGFYQLHYISRLLPDSLNLNYTLVSNEIRNLTILSGSPGLKVFWETAIGYSIYDFGKIGTLLASLIGGILVGIVIKYCNKKNDILALVLRIFICVAMFLTVEVSPLFDYFYIFPLFWIFLIIFITSRRTNVKYEKK